MVLEIWIEELKVCANERGGAFHSPSPRTALNHFGTFNVPDQYAQAVKDYVDKRKVFEENNVKIFPALKKQLVQYRDKHSKVN
ncbi:MAG: hypothetical protein JW760_12730 [Spirochaetales bacterium]|nr:hypothetical protein [Spirochaetales bacterium]